MNYSCLPEMRIEKTGRGMCVHTMDGCSRTCFWLCTEELLLVVLRRPIIWGAGHLILFCDV